jgi:hypothetical protein
MATFKATAALRCIINHVFLPPHLPSEKDGMSWNVELFRLIHASLQEFRVFHDGAEAGFVRQAMVAMHSLDQSRDRFGAISAHDVTELFSQMR